MANLNGSWGLKPVSKVGQNSNSTGVSGYTQYEIANGNSNAIYTGTPVIPLSTGFIDVVGAAAGGTVGLFANANFATATSGSTTTGMSSGTLAVSTINTTNTLNLRILGWVEDSSNEDFSAAGIAALVRLNNHYNSPNGAIAGGTVSTTGV
jgi:hypothetical protein